MNPASDQKSGGVELFGVTKRFPSGAIGIDNVSLSVRPGEFVTFLGPSGSGKTTTLNAIAGFVAPTEGSVHIDGRDVTDMPPNRRGLGMVFQNYALFPHMTIEANVAFGMHGRGFNKREIQSRVGEALEMVRLGTYGSRRPKELSGGQQQRVALARALVYRPPILLMDEPLGALDKQLRDQMQVEIARLHRDLGTTFLFVTHDQGEALALSDRIVLFREGSVEQVGPPETLYSSPSTRFAAEFLGNSTCFDGRTNRAGGLDWRGRGLGGKNPNAIPSGVEATLVVRPEDMRIVSREKPAGPHENLVSGEIVDLAFQGSFRRVGVLLEDGTRVALEERVVEGEASEFGAQADVAWDASAGVLVEGTA